jgi:hypothetical protein
MTVPKCAPKLVRLLFNLSSVHLSYRHTEISFSVLFTRSHTLTTIKRIADFCAFMHCQRSNNVKYVTAVPIIRTQNKITIYQVQMRDCSYWSYQPSLLLLLFCLYLLPLSRSITEGLNVAHAVYTSVMSFDFCTDEHYFFHKRTLVRLPFGSLYLSTPTTVLKQIHTYVETQEIWGHAVALLVEALCYKPEGREFDSRWGQRIFQLT